jgi:heptosyltransferase-2
MGWKRDALEIVVRCSSWLAPRASRLPEEPRSIFVLRSSGIGDLLLTTPLLAALRHRFPGAAIAVGTGSWAADVLANNPDVDTVLPVHTPWGNHLVQPQTFGTMIRYLGSAEARTLADQRFDIGIDVAGSAQGALLLMRAGIPWRLGVRGYAGGHTAAQQCIDYRRDEHVAVAGLRFAEALGATALPEPRPRLFVEADPHGAIVMAPGGGYASKCWPPEHFAALARLLAPRRIIVVGNETDRVSSAAIRAAASHVEDRTGSLSLRETLRTIGGASLVVCNSSMAMHAAAAFSKPCVTLLGAEFPSARAHARQWGHPETRLLGREPERDHLAQPREVFDFLQTEHLLAS